MRLILKHLFRSIKKKPTHPIILVLTLTLSVLVSIVSLATDSMIRDEIATATSEGFGNSSFKISLSSDSTSRFMFSSEVRQILGEGADAVGALELAAFTSDGSASLAVATELDRISDFFDFRFTEITPMPQNQVTSCVYISSDFAKRYDLSLNDTVELEVGRIKKNYRVAGISETDFMASYDLMLDVSGVMRILTAKSPVLSPMGDGFNPGGVIYVRVADDRVDEAAEALLENEKFSDKIITYSRDQLDNREMINTLSLPMRIAVLISLLLAAAVSFTCFYILSVERSEENTVLSCAGAGRKRLDLLQYIEVLVYFVIGGGIGLLLSYPVLRLLSNISGFMYVEPSIGIWPILIGELGLALTSALTVAIFTHRPRRRSARVHGGIPLPLLSIASYFVVFALVFLLPPSMAMLPLVGTIILVLLITLLVGGEVLHFVCRRLDRRGERAGNCAFCGIGRIPGYAVKNILKVKILANTSRLVALVSTFSISLAIVIFGYFGAVSAGSEMLNGDYAVLGATDRCYQSLETLESVDRVSRLYHSREKIGEVITSVISTDNIDVISDDLGVDRLPTGNEAVISRTHAKMLSLKVGDSLSARISGIEHSLVISDIVVSPTQFVLIDADSLGISYNMLIVDGAEGVSDDLLYEDITFATALELVGITSVSEMLHNTVRTVRIFLRAGIAMLVIALIFVFIGIIDNLAESYRARREEFELYRLAGMSPSDIRRMKLWEILITFGVGLCLGVVAFLVEFIALQEAVLRAGSDVLAGILYMIK